MNRPEQGPDFDAVGRLQAELRAESPRGVVLVSATMLKAALQELMLARLVPSSSGRILSSTARCRLSALLARRST